MHKTEIKNLQNKSIKGFLKIILNYFSENLNVIFYLLQNY